MVSGQFLLYETTILLSTDFPKYLQIPAERRSKDSEKDARKTHRKTVERPSKDAGNICERLRKDDPQKPCKHAERLQLPPILQC